MARVPVNSGLLATLVLLPQLLVAGSAVSNASAIDRPGDQFFTLTFGDLTEELQTARDDGKQGMLLFFESDYCPYCQHMIAHVFNQKAVLDWYGSRFVSISVDLHGDIELVDFDGVTLPSKAFSERRGIFFTPVIVFIDLDGVEYYRHPGAIKTPQEFLMLGEYVEGKHYLNTEYKTFISARGITEADNSLVTPSDFGDTT